MSTKTKVSEKKAEQVLEAIRNAFPAYLDALEKGPVLIPDFDGRDWTVMWEEGAPFEWPFLLGGGVDEEMASLLSEFMDDEAAGKAATQQAAVFPKGVFVEPVNHYSVGIYPA